MIVTALVQSALAGIGLWLCGVPHAGVLTALAFVLGVAQLGPLPVLPSPLSVNRPELGRELAAMLGNGPAILLRAHGMVVVGPDVRTAAVRALYLEENARRQCLAAPLGRPYVLSAGEIDACRKNLDKPNLFAKAWDYYVAKLD